MAELCPALLLPGRSTCIYNCIWRCDALYASNWPQRLLPFQAPWGGVKNSGFGRELGEAGLDAYLTLKQVTTYTKPEIWDWFSPPPSKL